MTENGNESRRPLQGYTIVITSNLSNPHFASSR